ncbi:hypothetical protein GALMADRAFT_214418 [Galerina marginata CBS 339.88]|uniref:Uncharacterized protein n=1 Tax=Galerina marginata (strain CBS 339.88) TaxID=685588 RepID=A0A067SSL6_GALM3|nr:hypothetical protein GALMADRAFT_214418 [Galerina marginata CBS 339.88]
MYHAARKVGPQGEMLEAQRVNISECCLVVSIKVWSYNFLAVLQRTFGIAVLLETIGDQFQLAFTDYLRHWHGSAEHSRLVPSMKLAFFTRVSSVSSQSKDSNICQRRVPRDIVKFLVCWIALVGTCFIAFLTSALHMAVKPLRFQAPDASNDDLFLPENLESKVITALRISDSFGIAVNFEISLLKAIVNYTGFKDSLDFTLRVERSVGTKLFVIMVGVTNLPVGALFAFSSIRANFPGAPVGFDIYTILPVLVIMSLCSFSLLLVILYRRIQEHKTEGDEERTLKDLKRDDRTGQTSTDTQLPSSTTLRTFPPRSQQPSADLSDKGEPTHDPIRSSFVRHAHRCSGEDE